MTIDCSAPKGAKIDLGAHSGVKAKLKANMILFGRVVNPNMYMVKSPDFHYVLADALTDHGKTFLNIIASRGHAKSSIVGGVFPLWHIMFDEGPKLVILVSRTQDHAIKLLGSIKDVLEYSENFRRIFGYWGIHSALKWAQQEVQLKDGTMIICKGTGQQLRGIKVGNQRPTLIIVDDPEDENNTKTAEAMETNLRWLLQSAVPALDPQRGRLAIIGTPQHQRCMVETLKDMKGWHNHFFAPDMKNGVALWEEWQSIEFLRNKMAEFESIGRLSVFYREYLCQIVGDEDQLFKEDDFRFYDGVFELSGVGEPTLRLTMLNGEEVDKVIPLATFTGVDPASSTKQTADYSVIFNVGRCYEGRVFILPYFRERASPLIVADEIIANFKLYKSNKTRIESTGYQEMLRQYVKAKCNEERIFIPGLEIKEMPRMQKNRRLESLQPYFAQHKIYMKSTMLDLKDELLMFPRGKHDDLLDGMYFALKNSYNSFEKAVQKNPEEKTLPIEDWQVS